MSLSPILDRNRAEWAAGESVEDAPKVAGKSLDDVSKVVAFSSDQLKDLDILMNDNVGLCVVIK